LKVEHEQAQQTGTARSKRVKNKQKQNAIRELKGLIKIVKANNPGEIRVMVNRDLPPKYPNSQGGFSYVMGLPYTLTCIIEIEIIPKTKKVRMVRV
jgi:hypothetical protein